MHFSTSPLLFAFCGFVHHGCLFSVYLFFCWTEEPQPVRRRPGIFLCPSSPTLSTDTLSLPGSGSVICGHGSVPRATTPPPPSSTRSDSALLRKSVSFTEDLLLAASGIVGLLCVEYPNLVSVEVLASQLCQQEHTVHTQIILTGVRKNINSACVV